MTAAQPLPDLIEEAANYLAMRGSIDPDDEYIPDEVVRQLEDLIRGGLHADVDNLPHRASLLADHWEWERQEEAERAVPVWQCDCGRRFKVLSPEDFWELGDGALEGPVCEPGTCEHESCCLIGAGVTALLGTHIGGVRRNTKGQVKHTDACPGCKTPFAKTIDAQVAAAKRAADPQGCLF